MYVTNRQLGTPLGFNPAVIPIASAIVKNTLRFFGSPFGGKLVWGLKKEEFEQRHNNSKWFRYLWYDGYWDKDGAQELPSGMRAQDYYVRRFNICPFIPHDETYDGFKKGNTTDVSLRLTSIPAGMPWPSDIASIPTAAINRVLPIGYTWDATNQRIVTSSAATTTPGYQTPTTTTPGYQTPTTTTPGYQTPTTTTPVTQAGVVAGGMSTTPVMLLIGGGLFLLWMLRR